MVQPLWKVLGQLPPESVTVLLGVYPRTENACSLETWVCVFLTVECVTAPDENNPDVLLQAVAKPTPVHPQCGRALTGYDGALEFCKTLSWGK